MIKTKNKKAELNFLLYLALIVIVIASTYLFIGVSVMLESKEICRDYCNDKGTKFSNVVENRQFFNTNDMCICYFENGTMLNHRNGDGK